MNLLFSLFLLSPAISIRGIALTPHYENRAVGLSFDQMVDEIAALGVDHISVVVQWSQRDIYTDEIQPHPKETQDEELVRRIIRRARGHGLKVLLFPILWVEQRALGEWRGTLKPKDEERWWQSYERFILHYADIAQEERAKLYSVGSELASLENREERWRALIRKVRARFSGKLLYSANWDHYEPVKFWDALDLIGLTAYYRLSQSKEPKLEELVESWSRVRQRLMSWRKRIGKPLIFTELGYPSVDGAASSPWDYTGSRPIDLDEQRLCFEAFAQVWRDEPGLSGLFVWNWWGYGGPQDNSYCPKGKPALETIKAWMKHRAGG